MANGAKNLSSMRSRRPQGGADDSPIPANVVGEPLNLQVQIGTIVVVSDGENATNSDASVFDATLQSAAGTGLNGYATGNHMFMHISTQDDIGTERDMKIYGYSYATQTWGILRVGFYDTGSDATRIEGGIDMVSITLNDAVAEHFIIPIYGVDRVAFGVGNGAAALDLAGSVRVTFNTF